MAATTYARSRQGMRREQPALRVEDAVNLTLDQPRGGEIPDIIEFTTSPDYLNRTLYPRQATLLKVIFLQTELFTDYDYKVIAEWTKEFHLPPEANRDEDKPLVYQGDWGIQPDVLERIEILKSQGRKWFKEVLAVIGRRGGKGYLGAICGAYVLWHYVCTGDPQEWYGIDRDKRLAALVFAGKKDQAKQNQWRDLVQVIINAPCFREHPLFRDLLSRALAESLTLFAPVQQRKRDIIAANSSMDLATFEILPKEATPMAGRGPAAYCLYFDEMAHVVATGANRGADEIYESSTPSLDQFGGDGFIYAGSSPWQMIGKFYELCQQALEVEHGTEEPVYPSKLLIQLESWAIYEDWERAHLIKLVPDGYARRCAREGVPFRVGDGVDAHGQPLRRRSAYYLEEGGRHKDGRPWYQYRCFKRLKRAPQTYDDEMRKLERANPETFAVERRCLDPNTRVLCADLTWRPIKDLGEGDEVVAVDEYGASGSHPNHPQQRKMRTATVVKKWINVDRAYRITFEDGSSVVCSGNHRWLSAPANTPASFYWRALRADPNAPGPRRSIKVGDTVRHLVDPWDEDRSWEMGYLAGVYDGEGTAIGYPRREFRVSFVQNRGEVLDATLQYLKEKGFDPHNIPSDRPAQVYVITGLANCMRFVGQTGAHKLRRQAVPAMWEGRAMGRALGRSSAKVVAAIEELPEQELVDIETTTGTFVAEGLISHNSKWAAALDTYLKPEFVDRMFEPWPEGRTLTMQTQGVLNRTYVAHGDPSKSGANFGWAIGHIEGPDEQGLMHVVFDKIHFWAPFHFEDGQIDYPEIGRQIGDDIEAFVPEVVTFDQFNSVEIMQRLDKRARSAHLPKRVSISEETATRPKNWMIAETFKTALGMNLLHAPHFEQLELEAKFLQDLGGKVDHPTMGPVQTKDVWDAVANVVYHLIGDQMTAFMAGEFRQAGIRGSGGPGWPDQEGYAAEPQEDRETFEALGSFARRRQAAQTAHLPSTQRARRRR